MKKKTYISGSIQFTPVIVILSERDGKATFDGIKEKLDKGDPVNELEVVYLPLYNNHDMSYEDVYKAIIELLPRVAPDRHEQDRMLTLSALLANKLVPEGEFRKILEAIKLAFEDNTMFKILEENGAIKKAREMARKLLELGVSLEIVKKSSGLSDSELSEIQNGILKAAPSN